MSKETKSMVQVVVLISIVGIALVIASSFEFLSANSSETFAILRAAKVLLGI